MISDIFTLGVRNIRRSKMRSWLTMIGIFIGVAAVVALISLGQGLQNAVNEQFALLGGDKLIIMPKGMYGAPGSGTVAVQLTTKDVDTIEKVNGIKDTFYMTMRSGKIGFGKEIKFNYVIGMPLEKFNLIKQMNFYKIDEGRLLEKGDRKKVLLGYNFKYNNFFSKPVSTRDSILINGESFEVIGIMQKIGNPDDDSSILISEEDMQELFSTGDKIDMIYAQVTSEADINAIADKVNRQLAKARNVRIGDEDFSILTPEELMGSFQQILQIVQVFLVGIAAISLIVGGIGIMNTMYTSVLERTKEIGIMKAIGARNREVLLIFLIESGLLGLVGGAIGILIGVGVGKLVGYIAGVYLGSNLLQAAFPLWLILGALGFSFIIGMLSGILPAYQASRLKPVDALRYE